MNFLKIGLVLIFFSSLIIAQNKSPLYYFLTSAGYGIATGLSEGYRMEEQWSYHSPEEKLKLNKTWHAWKFGSHVMGIGLGISVSEYSDLEIISLIKSILTSAVIFFVFHDMFYNLARGYPIFRVSEETGAFTERFSHPKYKALLILSVITIQITL